MPRNANKLKITAAVISGAFLLSAGLSGCNRGESAATLVTEAKSYQQKGDLKAALIQLKNAVNKAPEDAAIRLALGELYNETGDPLSAEKEFRKASSLGAKPEQFLPGLATSLQSQGQFKKLLEETEAASATGGAVLLVARGNAYLATGQADQAKASFEAALKVNPNDGNALLGMASHAFVQKDAEGGARFAEEAAAKDPKNPDVWMFKAMLAARAAKPDAAIVAYDQVLTLKPNHRSANIEKAHAEIGMGKFAQAKASLDAARKTTPGSPMVTYTQALLDHTQGKNELALESIQKVLRAMPEHMPTILLAGAIQLSLGQLEQSEQNLKKYLEAFPGNLYARKLLASAQLKAAHPADAAATLAPALKVPSEDAQLLALAGESSMQARDFSKAAEYFEKASAISPNTAALRTSLGMSKLGQGDNAKAIAEMEKATELDPKSQQAGIALVRTALSLKQFDKALKAVEALEKQQPDNAIVHNLKGGVYLAKEDPASARAAFNKAITLQPTYFPAVANLTQMDLNEKKPAEAKKRLEAFLVNDKKHISAMTALAEMAASTGNAAEATSWLEKANTENPDVVAPAMRLATQYLRTGEKAKALTLVRKFQTANPTNPDLLDQLGQTQIANNDAAAALETYSKLANVVPKSPLPHLRLAQVHTLLKNEPAVQEDIKRALAIQPDNVQAQLIQIELAMNKGQFDPALALARKLQKQDDKGFFAHVVEGDILMVQKKPELAIKAYQQGMQRAKNPQTLLKLVQAMRSAGKNKEADAQMVQWLKEAPNDPLAIMFQAETQLAAKELKPAIANFEKLVKANPKNVVAMNNLAYAYQQDKDARALATAEAALALAADNPAVLDTLAWILIEKGDTKRALPLLEKALSRAPDANEIRYHLAYGLHKAGDKAKAKTEVEKALANGKSFATIDEARALLKQL